MKIRTVAVQIFLLPLISSVVATVCLLAAQTPTPTPLANSSPTPMAAPSPKVTAVEGHLELDTIIKVQIDHLSDWAVKNNPSKLVPYIDGLGVRGNYPQEIHASKNICIFICKSRPKTRTSG